MLSLKTCIELASVLDTLDHAEIDRILNVFGLEIYLKPIDISRKKKINALLEKLKEPSCKGPFSTSFQMDLLQYLINNFYRNKDHLKFISTLDDTTFDFISKENEEYDGLFSKEYKQLGNYLKMDGFTVKGLTIKKLLPDEIEEAKSESELSSLLLKFGFTTTKGHLEQARNNYAQSNWAGANSQFRTFIESLLLEICKKILPDNFCNTANSAINLLSNTANPPFLKSELNEVENRNCETPFVTGFWKRLHPEGAHPGLSDEEDSTFRYHLCIVFAHHMLKRFEKRA